MLVADGLNRTHDINKTWSHPDSAMCAMQLFNSSLNAVMHLGGLTWSVLAQCQLAIAY